MNELYEVRIELLRLTCRPGLTPEQVVAFAMELESYVRLEADGRQTVEFPKPGKAVIASGDAGKDQA